MKKSLIAIFYCLMIGIQAFFCLCACETMNGDDAKVVGAAVNTAGKLIITLDNGQVIDAGLVVGEDGFAGKDGKDGEDGKSAYEIYCDAFGYLGTEKEWIADLVSGNLGTCDYTYGLSYALLADGTLSVSIGTAGNVEHVVIPEKFNGYTVSAVAENGFEGDVNLKSVTLPDTITKIGAGAFRCCLNLEKIELPLSVAEIGAGAFDYCTKLPAQELSEQN